MKFMGWMFISIFIALAIGLPLVLVGVPKDYIWPISLSVGAIFLLLRPGGSAEKFFTSALAYALVFAIWCVAGIIVAVIFNIATGIGKPTTIFIVLAVGAFGAIREATKPASASRDSDA